jgi:hypothetical protein
MKDWRKTKRTRKKGREKEWYNPFAASSAPEHQTLTPLHTAISFERKFPDLSGPQEVHHHLAALLYGKQLKDLHVLASARFLACSLSHCLPECCLLAFQSSAVAEEVLPCLRHSPSTPPGFSVISVAEPLQVHFSGHMQGLQMVQRGCQLFYACHWERSFGLRIALQSVTAVLSALVTFQLRLRSRPSLGDLPSSV